MTRGDSISIVHVRTPPSRLSMVRDVATILVCAALVLGALADVLVRSRPPAPPAPRAVGQDRRDRLPGEAVLDPQREQALVVEGEPRADRVEHRRALVPPRRARGARGGEACALDNGRRRRR